MRRLLVPVRNTVVGLALLAGAVGCGDDDDATTGTTAAADGECRFVSTAAVQAVFGASTELVAANEGCVFRTDAALLQFSYIGIGIDPEQYAQEALETSCDEGTAVEVDAGDRAYACISFVGPLGNFYDGRDLVVINTSDVEDGGEEAVRDLLADLLPEISAG